MNTDLPFAPVPLWVLELPVTDRAIRLYGLLAGLRDYNTGEASFGRKLLAKKLKCSADSLDRAKAELEEHGAITVTRGTVGEGGIPRNVYTINRIPAASRNGAARDLAAGVRLSDSRTGAATNEKKNLNESSSSSSNGWLPRTVGRGIVTEFEREQVDSLLDLFNELSGKRYAGKSWREAIIRRMREHPEVGLDDHQALVRRQFERPWWKGDPTPSVIWGNDRVFDRALNGAQAAPLDPDLEALRGEAP